MCEPVFGLSFCLLSTEGQFDLHFCAAFFYSLKISRKLFLDTQHKHCSEIKNWKAISPASVFLCRSLFPYSASLYLLLPNKQNNLTLLLLYLFFYSLKKKSFTDVCFKAQRCPWASDKKRDRIKSTHFLPSSLSLSLIFFPHTHAHTRICQWSQAYLDRPISSRDLSTASASGFSRREIANWEKLCCTTCGDFVMQTVVCREVSWGLFDSLQRFKTSVNIWLW